MLLPLLSSINRGQTGDAIPTLVQCWATYHVRLACMVNRITEAMTKHIPVKTTRSLQGWASVKTLCTGSLKFFIQQTGHIFPMPDQCWANAVEGGANTGQAPGRRVMPARQVYIFEKKSQLMSSNRLSSYLLSSSLLQHKTLDQSRSSTGPESYTMDQH